jgi:hypothetical protein
MASEKKQLSPIKFSFVIQMQFLVIFSNYLQCLLLKEVKTVSYRTKYIQKDIYKIKGDSSF